MAACLINSEARHAQVSAKVVGDEEFINELAEREDCVGRARYLIHLMLQSARSRKALALCGTVPVSDRR